MFGYFGMAKKYTCINFVSQSYFNIIEKPSHDMNKIVKFVTNTRNISKLDMIHNSYLPNIEVNPETYEVRADGDILTCEPAQVLPMAQRYFLY